MKNKFFIVIFALLLVGPTLLWACLKNYVDTSSTENRTLAEKPVFSISTIADYPESYESYYNDHLPFKSMVVKAKTFMDIMCFHTVDSEKVLLGKDNWLFYKGIPELPDERPVLDYQRCNLYSEEELDLFCQNVNSVDMYMKNQGIDFSIMICPNKECVYTEYMPNSFTVLDGPSKADVLVQRLKETTNVPIFYASDEILSYKDSYQLYYKYDTHWNMLGGFVASQQLTDYYQQEKHSLDEYEIGIIEDAAANDLAVMLNLGNYFSDDDYYFVENYKPEVTAILVSEFEERGVNGKVYESNAADDRTLMVIRDSFGERLYDTLPKDFARVIFVHRDIYDASYIEKYQPDIVVFEVVERATGALGNLETIFEIEK